MVAPKDILAFWLDEVGPDGWYKQNDGVDEHIRSTYLPVWKGAMEGRFALWLTYPSGVLAYIILTDQFSRNMFRNSPQAFASDVLAKAAAKQAIHRGWDLRIDEPARQFFYMPLSHSENLSDQERSVRLIKQRMPDTGALLLLHARTRREIIRSLGRFPYRNDALGRTFSTAEQDFVEAGGYSEVMRSLQTTAVA